MNYLREKDDKCIRLCKLQSRLFERASIEKIPSAYFVKVFANSKYCNLIDNLDYFDYSFTDDEIFNYVKSNVKMTRGTIITPQAMSWIGYLLREWAYIYRTRMKAILKNVPLSFLNDVYPMYHALDIQKAIQLIAESRGININESPEERLRRIVEKYCCL